MISRGKSGYYRNEDIGGKSWKNAVKLDEDLFKQASQSYYYHQVLPFPEVVHWLYQKYITFQEVLNILASCWTLEKSLWSSHEVAKDLNLFDKMFR